MWHLWRFRPRPLCRPWQWPWDYYAWHLETFIGIPASEVRWRTVLMSIKVMSYVWEHAPYCVPHCPRNAVEATET